MYVKNFNDIFSRNSGGKWTTAWDEIIVAREHLQYLAMKRYIKYSMPVIELALQAVQASTQCCFAVEMGTEWVEYSDRFFTDGNSTPRKNYFCLIIIHKIISQHI